MYKRRRNEGILSVFFSHHFLLRSDSQFNMINQRLVENEAGDANNDPQEIMAHDFVDVEEGYKTPTSEEHRIPPALICPPAPKKMRVETGAMSWGLAALACRRKLVFDDVQDEKAGELFTKMEMKKEADKRRRRRRSC